MFGVFVELFEVSIQPVEEIPYLPSGRPHQELQLQAIAIRFLLSQVGQSSVLELLQLCQRHLEYF